MATGIGEALASAVVKELVKKLSSPLWGEIGLLAKFTDDLENMKGTLETLDAVLKDAERRSGREEGAAERLWLKRLKMAAYKVDDMLSDYEAKIPIKKDKYNMVRNLQTIFSSSNSVVLRVAMAHKMKGMRKKVNAIAAEHAKFNFNISGGSSEQDEIASRETTSVIDENYKSTIIGREKVKEDLVRMLLDENNEEKVTIIPIVGLGGLGKTTLAKLLFRDEKVQSTFDLKAWVYVSTKFDLKKIGQGIIESLKTNPVTYTSKEAICNEVKKCLEGKRFFIVLDDVWEKDGQNLEELKCMLQGGASNSKVVLTTRSKQVASMMCGNEPQYLKVLSDDECWALFSQRAFKSEAEKNNKELAVVGRDIVKKCQGIPLAAIALGYTMRSKEGIDSWRAVKDNQLWEFELQGGSSLDNKILPSLKLSYYNMPSHLKLCFVYCSIFPKGYDIYKDELIQEWIGLGFIQQKRGLKLEQIGEEYVSHLMGLSFLQCNDYFADRLGMHDLVHDLALFIADNEILFLDNKEKINFNFNYCRYARLMNYKEMSGVCRLLPRNLKALYLEKCCISKASKILSNLKGLRVLCLNWCDVENPSNFISEMKQLRYLRIPFLKNRTILESISHLHKLIALNLSTSLLEEVPICISKLKELRFLNVSRSRNLKKLNDSFTKLQNLERLDLSGCRDLETLPDSIGDLKNLSFLNLSYCDKLQNLPESIGCIRSLEHLNLCRCSELRELPESIGSIRNLKYLELSDCRELKEIPQSFSNLCNLRILKLERCYSLQSLPEPLSDLNNLLTLNLSYCKDLEELPNSFGKFVNSEDLNIRGCGKIQKIPESIGNLKNMRKLNLLGCDNIKLLPQSICEVTNLEFLKVDSFVTLPSIAQLVNLKELNNFNVEMKVGRDGSIVCNIMDIRHLKHLKGELEISNLKNVKRPNELDNELLCHKSKLKYLVLNWSCEQIFMPCLLFKNGAYIVLKRLRPHRNLQHLRLKNYPGVIFPDWMMDISIFLPNLTEIELNGLNSCNHLPPLGQLPNLEELRIANLCRIEKVDKAFAGGKKPFRKLTELQLYNLQNLEEWCTIISDEGEENVFMFRNLLKFGIKRCEMLKFVPFLPESVYLDVERNEEIILSEQSVRPSNRKTHHMCILSSEIPGNRWKVLEFLPTLKSLIIDNCIGLRNLPESIKGLTALESLKINNCKNLIELGENMQYLVSLKKLDISSCGNLINLSQSTKNLILLEDLIISHCELLVSPEDSLLHLTSLRRLVLNNCTDLVCLPQTLGGLVWLRELFIGSFQKLESLPQDLGNLTSLEELDIIFCPKLESLPESIQHLNSLKCLRIYDCTTLEKECLGKDRYKIAHIPYVDTTEGPGWYTKERIKY